MKYILKSLIITLIVQISFAQVNTETMRETNPKKEFRSKAKFDSHPYAMPGLHLDRRPNHLALHSQIDLLTGT